MTFQAEQPAASHGEFSHTEFLLACMQERLELLEGLKDLAESQSIAATHTEIDMTLGLLARKQTLLEGLSKLQHQLRPYFVDDPEARVWRTSERRQLCRRLADQGQRLLHEALQLERNSLEQISTRRDAVAAQLQDGQDSILAHSAYQADQFLTQSFLDIDNL